MIGGRWPTCKKEVTRGRSRNVKMSADGRCSSMEARWCRSLLRSRAPAASAARRAGVARCHEVDARPMGESQREVSRHCVAQWRVTRRLSKASRRIRGPFRSLSHRRDGLAGERTRTVESAVVVIVSPLKRLSVQPSAEGRHAGGSHGQAGSPLLGEVGVV